MPILYIITGLPGAGKTTLAKKMVREEKADFFFEADMWMLDENLHYFFNPKKLEYCHNKCQIYTERVLKRGKSVVVSNTTLTRKEAEPYLKLANTYNATVEVIHLPDSEYKSIHNVPQETIKKMKEKRELWSI